MKTKMKANVFYGPEDMRLEEFDIPAVEDDCALLRVCACGICGTDHIFIMVSWTFRSQLS